MFEHDYKNYPELTNIEIEVLQFSSPHVQITEDFDAIVFKVHDGDTVTLKTEFRDFNFPLRFLDIDALELSEGGKEAGDWLRNKILGKKVRVLIDKRNRVDKYGRLLGKIEFEGLIISEEEIYLGLAKPYGTIKEGQVPNLNKVLPKVE